jgi:hypothetical protein
MLSADSGAINARERLFNRLFMMPEIFERFGLPMEHPGQDPAARMQRQVRR